MQRFHLRSWRGRVSVVVLGLVLLYAVLLIPLPESQGPPPPDEKPFAWNQNERWLALEQAFKDARARGCQEIGGEIDRRLESGRSMLAEIDQRRPDPESAVFDSLEENTFQLGPLIGVCQERLPEYIDLVTDTRASVKQVSETWDMDRGKARLYRLLWGGRVALEEVMLQCPTQLVPPLVMATDEPSATPSSRILGVTIHSGDLLVSRGGAPISALVAAGNDYPGHFSHVAIVHIDERTSIPTVIEANEHGVHTANFEKYLEDIKLRVMVLRIRSDLEPVTADPLLPHRAAEFALERGRREDTPYDFSINHEDDSSMYCSEVPAWAYRQAGITLWMNMSRISAPGTRRWMHDLGARRFQLQEPADLEYDPQLRVVAEWRDPETLYLDHIDTVVMDAMLDGASPEEPLSYSWAMLPVARVAKGWSLLMEEIGLSGPVPEGLCATSAARVLYLNHRHKAIKKELLARAEEFRTQEGYRPPEWQLLRMAKEARRDAP